MQPNYASQTLDHLGLVSVMYDELGIGELLDRTIKQDQRFRHVSVGQAVKALVLNGLGFANRALYLAPQYFTDKPLERLLGAGIKAEQLNDDTLGRALDTLYWHDLEALFMLISAQACQRLGLDHATVHLDSSSFHSDGRYDLPVQEGVIEIVRGYSRDHRPELNQVMLNLIVEQRAGLPVLMQPLSGNSNDTASFGQLIEKHIDNLNTTHQIDYWIADAALYSEENLKLLSAHQTHWITRVPETLSLAKQLRDEIGPMQDLAPGYRYRSVTVDYAEVRQRWLLITSAQALERATATVDRQLAKLIKQEYQAWEKLCRQRFACEADARQALERFVQAQQILQINEVQIHQDTTQWSFSGLPASNSDVRWLRLWQRATFILATNELDLVKLSDQAVLGQYKQQQQAEKGFRFLKDPRFQAHTLFLKSAHRIMALMMVMTICLLVYAALEYRLRQALSNTGHGVANQKGKRTQRPTMRWVFQFFSGIHVLIIDGQAPLVLNLKPPQQQVIALLGVPYERFYGIEVGVESALE